MEHLHDFIETNMVVVNFVYGLVYFTFGMAIALQRRNLSNFRLARHLWLLATFGIVHGLAEWGNVFIPIQASYLSQGWMDLLGGAQTLAWAVSYAFLLQFAVLMIAPRLPWISGIKAFVRWYTPLWSAAVIMTSILFIPDHLGECWIRYLLGFPGASLTAMVFLLERRSFRDFPAPSTRLDLSLAAAAFAGYAVLGGLVVPAHGIWPIAWMNYSHIFSTTGLPIQFYRTLAGLFIAIFVIRTLSVFDVEIRHRLEDTERKHALLEERHRIARDLHDGVIQDIYAAGLQLEAATSSFESSPQMVRDEISHILMQLNKVISDIRGYIFKLGPARAGMPDFYNYMNHIVQEFSSTGPISASLDIRGEGEMLSAEQRQNIVFIVRECLSNISRHSLASRADIELEFLDQGARLRVIDDGVGMDYAMFDVTDLDQQTGGLGNMAARARSIRAELSIKNRPGRGGTEVALWIPYESADESDEAGAATVTLGADE
jgi:signal transduction histidine kinase